MSGGSDPALARGLGARHIIGHERRSRIPDAAGLSFVTNGAPSARNALLLTAGAELRLPNRVSVGGKPDGEFASGSRTYAGSATIRYGW